MTKDKIYRLALASGFAPKEQPDGTMDLHHYVYDFADRLLKDRAAELAGLRQRMNDLMDMLEDDSRFVYEIRLAAGDNREQLTKSELLQRIRQRCSDPENAELDAEFNRCASIEWIPMSKQHPPLGKPVLVFYENPYSPVPPGLAYIGTDLLYLNEDDGLVYWLGVGVDFEGVSHWAPIDGLAPPGRNICYS